MNQTSLLIRNLFKLIRWNNLLIIAITQYVAAYFLIEKLSYKALIMNPDMALLCLGTILIAAAGYVINDYYDVKIDYVNKPERVVVGRFLTRRAIIILHATLNTLGVAAGIMVSWQIGVLNFFVVGLLWLYSNQLKRLPLLGNITVALLTGLSVFVVYLLYHESIFLFATYSFFAFFISLIREIIKDMEDVEGDKKFDCNTLPIALGIRKSKLVIYLICLLFIIVVAALMQQEPKFWWVFSGLVLVLGWLGRQLFNADKSKDYANLSLLSKQIMLLGLISMVFLK